MNGGIEFSDSLVNQGIAVMDNAVTVGLFSAPEDRNIIVKAFKIHF
jgi:hypothetical protein